MAKIIVGAAMIGGAVALIAVGGGFGAVGAELIISLLTTGVSTEISGIMDQLRTGMGDPFSTRQAAGPRQIVYGQMRVAGDIVFMSTTGHQLNHVVVWACHPCQSIDNVYIDARKAILDIDGSGIGGPGDPGTFTDDAGNHYTFGSKLAIYNWPGSAAGYWFSQLHGNDAKWTSDCTLNNLCASYIKTTYDANVYAGPPNVKATVHGKNDIYDPRTGLHGWTDNAALIIADFLCNTDFGVGCNYATEIDEPQLIAAANICDELVPLANGNSEKRYTINGAFDTSRAPGDVLSAMLMACEGRFSYSGGRFKIFPAAWYGSTLAFGTNDLAGPVKWTSKRKYRELINAVRATYICPQYPYAVTGYDKDNKDSSIFNGEWQPTDAPEYAQDALHGYSSDANLTADNNVKLYQDRRYQFVVSCATAQRLMKIFMLRNRQQGSGTLTMKLSALQAEAVDVIQMNFPTLGWVNKYLEVSKFRMVPSENGHEVPVWGCELDVIETDPSVYSWSTAEERGIQNTTSPTIGRDWDVGDPSGLSLTSGSSTAVIGIDGIVQPRILVQWTEPSDPFVTAGGHIEVQYQPAGASAWTSVGKFEGTVQSCYILGVVSAQTYNVRVRSNRANGAVGDWVEVDGHIVSTTRSTVPQPADSLVHVGTSAGGSNYDSRQIVRRYYPIATGDQLEFDVFIDANNPEAKYGPDFQYAPNLVTNGDLTGGTAGWTSNIATVSELDPWGITRPVGRCNSLSSFQSFGNGVSVSVAPGQQYVIDFWAKSLFGGGAWTLYVANFGDAGLFPLGAPRGWTHFVFSYTVPSGTDYSGALQFLVANGSATADQMDFCAVNVYSVSAAAYGRDASLVDQNAIGFHPATDLTAWAKGAWCHRSVSLSSLAGKVASSWASTHEGDTAGLYIGRLANLKITNAGTVKAVIWQSPQQNGTAWNLPAWNGLSFGYSGVLTYSVAVGSGLTALGAYLDPTDGSLASSTLLNPQGSIVPNQTVRFSVSGVSSSGFSVGLLTASITRADGSSLVLHGSVTYGGLSSSTTYFVFPYINAADGSLGFANPNPPSASSVNNDVYAAEAAYDGRIPLPPLQVTTASSGGGGGGYTGGGDTCPESAEFVDVQGKGQIAVGSVQVGDMIRGKSFQSGQDVYRRVVNIGSESCHAWRMVDGHRVSPCEAVWDTVSGAWTAAFRVVRATTDSMLGRKVYLAVATDDYNESNYYLIGQVELLVHNGYVLPC